MDNVVRSLKLAEMRVIVAPAHSGFAVGILTGIVEICTPVSYTHLDVYKRQV